MTIISEATNETTMRRHMIDGHLLPNNVTDQNVIDAIEQVNRVAFVPAGSKGVAYIDKSIKISDERFMMEPLTLAKMLSAADIKPTELALDIAPNTGYSSAILSMLVDAVVAIEEDKALADLACENLASQDCDNVAVINSDHKDGLAKQGPYDLIFINGMIDEVPQALLDQLNSGGRILCVLNQDGFGRAALITYNDNIMGTRIVFDTSAPRLKGFEKATQFVF
ncbi:MAG: protein-L-isoaspartate O-methyltransferase [Emcibacteraceae bacterium]|nr:protein-L-isoaspartate O-methyltransferase [Emcibacteraceae bacterium]